MNVTFQRKATISPPKQNGVLNGEPSTSKQESGGIATESKESRASKESKDQNHCHQDDSDEQTIDNGEKKKKANKNKWVPLEIDLQRARGTVRSSRFHSYRERNGELNDDEHWREKSYDRSTGGYQGRGGRGGRSYRSRGRGGRNRGGFRHRQDNEYASYNADYMQVMCSVGC